MKCTFIKTYEPRYNKERTYFLVGTKRRKGAVVLEVAGRQRVTKTDVEAHQIALHCPPQVLNISQQFHSVSAPLLPPRGFLWLLFQFVIGPVVHEAAVATCGGPLPPPVRSSAFVIGACLYPNTLQALRFNNTPFLSFNYFSATR